MALVPQGPSTFTPPPPTDLVALDTASNLLIFNSSSPGSATRVSVTGLLSFERREAIDFRPVNRQLYGLAIRNATGPENAQARLYRIDLATGAATPVAAGDAPFVAGLMASGSYGFDFDPVADEARH